MIVYYALFKQDKDVGPAVGLIIMEVTTGDAVFWDHSRKGWVYDPELAIRTLDEPKNWRRVKETSRDEAEIRVMEVTRANPVPLPDEETIRWMFAARGNPTQSDD